MHREAAKPSSAVLSASDHGPVRERLRPETDLSDTCAAAAGNLAVARVLGAHGIRAKLKVSQRGDPEEEEADRLADAMISGSSVPAVQRKCAGCSTGHPCSECEEEKLQPKLAAGEARANMSRAHAAVAAVASGGQPVPRQLRAAFEPRLNQPLSGVRLHTDATAEAAAQRIGARAYTVGSHIAFAPGEFSPADRSGQQLIAHELVHVVQQDGVSATHILRDETPDAGVPTDAGVQPRSDLLPNGLDPSGAGFPGVTLTTHYPTAIAEMYNLVETVGRKGPKLFVDWLAVQADNSTQALDVSAGVPEDSAVAADKQLQTGVLPTYRTAAAEVTKAGDDFLDTFYTTAKANALNILQANEQQAKAEMIRYGITETQIDTYADDEGSGGAEGASGGGSSYTEYAMSADAPAGKGLQAAAKLLLPRKRALDEARIDQQNCSRVMSSQGASGAALERLNAANDKLKHVNEDYLKLRAAMSARYPALAAFSDPEGGNSDLETLADKGAGSNMAALIGERVAKQRERIATVRANIDDKSEINLWRQEKVVGLTRIQTEANSTPWKSKLVDETVQDEAPGILFDLAVAVLNIVALLAAGPTGGASLVVAAGVNAAVAAQHVEDYLMQEALSGTAFDKAQAISQEEPSLFWLAVEIVGVFADAATAASAMIKTFRTLKGPVLLVKAAHTAEEVEEAERVLRAAAQDLGKGEEATERIVANAKAMRGGDEEALRLAGLNTEEVSEFAKVGEIAPEERIGAEVSGEAGKVNLSKHGDLYTCASPCSVLRDKYATVLAADEGAMNQVVDFERRATEIADARKAAANDPAKLAQLESDAQKLKQEVAQFEPNLRAKMPERVAYVKWVESLKGSSKVFDGLDAGALERILKMRPDVQRMKGQLLEELIGSRFADKAAREAAAGKSAVSAATKANSEIEFIPGHLIRDADGKMLTDGVLAYREGGQYKIVAIIESKAGKASAQKLGRAWKDIPHPSSAAEQTTWRTMSKSDLDQLRRTNRGLAKDIETWREVRMEAIEEMRELNPALANKSSAQIEKQFASEVDATMDRLPKGESGQARKSMERLLPGAGSPASGIQIGTQNVDGSVTFAAANVTASPKTTKLIGVVPDNVPGKSLQRIAQREKIGFELMKDIGISEPDLRAAAEALNDAAKASP